MKAVTRVLHPFVTVFDASREMFTGHWYKALFLTQALFFLTLYVMLPVWLIPGNDLAFQIRIWSAAEITLIVFLAFLTALLFTMQLFLFLRVGRRAFSDGGTGVASSMSAAFIGVAGCVGCSIGIALGFLGMGAILFLIEYQLEIAIGAIMLFFASLYLIARRITGYCKTCEVSHDV